MKNIDVKKTLLILMAVVLAVVLVGCEALRTGGTLGI
jgi:hypothetical protein